jgi:hypothetical protein
LPEADRSLDGLDPVSDLQTVYLACWIAVRSFVPSPFSFLVALDAPKLVGIFNRKMAKASCLYGKPTSSAVLENRPDSDS